MACAFAVMTGLVTAGCASSDAPPRHSLDTTSRTQPPDARAASAELARDSWTLELSNSERIRGVAITTRHYRIHTTSGDEVLVNRMAPFAESMLEAYRLMFPDLPGPPERMVSFVVGTRPQWVRVVQQQWNAQAGPFLTVQRGGVTAGGISVLYDLGQRDTLVLLAHEGWHQYAQMVLRDPLPVWLDESVATLFEGFRSEPDAAALPRTVFRVWANPERFDRLREASQSNALRGLRELLELTPGQLASEGGDALTWYAQCWALALWMHEDPDRSAILRGLLADAHRGSLWRRVESRLGPRAAMLGSSRRVGSEVFRTYFDDDLDRAERSYRAFVDRVVRVGAREHIVAGRSPLLAP